MLKTILILTLSFSSLGLALIMGAGSLSRDTLTPKPNRVSVDIPQHVGRQFTTHENKRHHRSKRRRQWGN